MKKSPKGGRGSKEGRGRTVALAAKVHQAGVLVHEGHHDPGGTVGVMALLDDPPGDVQGFELEGRN